MSGKNRALCFVLVMVLFSMYTVRCFADGEAVYADNKQTLPKAEILMECSTAQVLYDSNSRTKLPVGTLAKLMTVLIVAESIDNGELTEESLVTAGSNAFQAKGASIWLNQGEKMTVHDLLKGVIIGNANDASVALAEEIGGSETEFVKLMNSRARELGMYGTSFTNCTGYDDDNSYSTAYDTALLTRELVSHDFLIPYMTTYMDELRGGETQLVNVNNLVRDYDGSIGVKSAFTEKSGYCLSAAAERDGTVFVAVVLGCSDKDESISAGRTLLNKGFNGYEIRMPSAPDELFGGVAVRGGVERSVLVRPADLSEIVIPNGSYSEIETEVILPEFVEAPVEQNQKIGKVKFLLNSEEIYSTDLLASSDVEDMTFFNALCILLKSAITF